MNSYDYLIHGQMCDRSLEPPDEPDPVCYCEYCGNPIYEGDRIWTIGWDRICEECAINQYSEVAGNDD